MSALLEACGIPTDEIGSEEMLAKTRPRVLCLSCGDANIVLGHLDVVSVSSCTYSYLAFTLTDFR